MCFTKRASREGLSQRVPQRTFGCCKPICVSSGPASGFFFFPHLSSSPVSPPSFPPSSFLSLSLPLFQGSIFHLPSSALSLLSHLRSLQVGLFVLSTSYFKSLNDHVLSNFLHYLLFSLGLHCYCLELRKSRCQLTSRCPRELPQSKLGDLQQLPLVL